MTSTSDPAVAVLDELQTAATAYRDANAAVEEYGTSELEHLTDQYEQARDMLLTYEDKATDTGIQEFVSFAQFKSRFISFVENLDDELPGREHFLQAKDHLDQRRLSSEDFQRAHEALDPVKDLVDRLDQRSKARDRLIRARQQAVERRAELQDEIAQYDRMLTLGQADLDAPIERIQAPIEQYNSAVRDGFDRLRREQPVRELLALLERSQQYPLVDFQAPPAALASYLQSGSISDQPLVTLLEYTEYSPSKLSHYVPDAGEFRRHIATNRTYLQELDSEPLLIDWPPPAAEHIPWLVRELRPLAARIIDEDSLAALRSVRRIAENQSEYQHLRRAAVAHAELSPSDRERLESGTIAAERETLTDAVERINAALADAPNPD